MTAAAELLDRLEALGIEARAGRDNVVLVPPGDAAIPRAIIEAARMLKPALIAALADRRHAGPAGARDRGAAIPEPARRAEEAIDTVAQRIASRFDGAVTGDGTAGHRAECTGPRTAGDSSTGLRYALLSGIRVRRIPPGRSLPPNTTAWCRSGDTRWRALDATP